MESEKIKRTRRSPAVFYAKRVRKPKPKVTSVWSPEDVKLLIASIEQRTVIWDFACYEYKNLTKREAAWQQVEAIFNYKYGIPECKAKWANIKTAYQKVRNKLWDPKTGEIISTKPPRWEYWCEMQFLNCKSEPTLNNSITDNECNSSTSTENMSNAISSTFVNADVNKSQDTEQIDFTLENDEHKGQETNKRPRKPKPKVTASWPFKDVKLLISLVEKHAVIWDFTCAEHRNFTEREAAWNQVNAVFGNKYSVIECKAKWANVKTAYQKVKKKILGSPFSQPHWAYWKDIQFLNGESESIDYNISPKTELLQFPQHFAEVTSSSFASNSNNGDLSFLPAQCVATDLMTTATQSEDGWQTVGDYFAVQLRRVSQKSKDAAERIHRKLLKTLLDSLEEFDKTEADKTNNGFS